MLRSARLSLVAITIGMIAQTAAAHLLVDIKMSVNAPAFVATRQKLTYQVIADDLANDSAFGVVVTDTLPSSVTFVKASGTGWNCSESKLKVTCSAEQIAAGPNTITIDVTAPAASGPITNSVTVTSLGSFDPNSANDNASVTTTVYDPAACAASSLQLLGATGTNPVHLSWSAVPNAKSYVVFAAVEGERSAIVATTTEMSTAVALERGNVEWHVEATLGGCPTIVSATGRFFSDVPPETLVMSTLSDAFASPAGVAVDSKGSLFVADAGDYTIRQVSTQGEVTLLAGTPNAAGGIDGRPASFASPMGITITPMDDFLFIADRANEAVRLRYPGDLSLGYVITICGALGHPGMADGNGEVSLFYEPSAIGADPRGRLYVADSKNHRIRKVTSVPGFIGYYASATFSGAGEGFLDGPTGTARFSSPSGVAVDGEDVVYVSDTGNHAIRKIFNGNVTTLAGSGGVPGSIDGSGGDARFNAPGAMAIDPRGNLYVCDRGNHAIRRVAPSGMVTTVAHLSEPSAIVVDPNGTIYIADAGAHRVVIAHVAGSSVARRHAVRP
jgi:uncharacterized repeat protein (TIGR01451 family)